MAKKNAQDKALLAVPHSEAETKIRDRISLGREFAKRSISTVEEAEHLIVEIDQWDDFNRALLDTLFTTNEMTEKYSSDTRRMAFSMYDGITGRLREKLEDAAWALNSLEQINNRLLLLEVSTAGAIVAVARPDSLDRVKHLLSRFHVVQRQLRAKRHDNRKLFVEQINDEYDVQDLLHALLKVDFDDVRPEEWAPSYAGSQTRMDFVLKAEQIVVEAKCTRKNLSDKKLGEQLAVDIVKYQTHPDCKTLVCFIYDPGDLVTNPQGLISDLERATTESLRVVALVNPKR